MNRYAHWLLQHRLVVIVVAVAITSVLGIFGAGIKVIINTDALSPQGHPYTQATSRIEHLFSSRDLLLIGITAKQGDVFQPAVLERIERITRKLEASPNVVRTNILSLAARQAKVIRGTAEGFEARPLLERMPKSAADKAALKTALVANPVYMNTVVSPDFRTAAILVQLQQRSGGFRKMVDPVREIVSSEAGEEVEIHLTGHAAYLAKSEEFAARINMLFPIALLVIALLHFEAFRTKQGLILPLVTALMAVVWGLGFMGATGQRLDIFNSPTPILILAVAAGHAVQLLKRYYEEYEQLRVLGVLSPKDANREAVIRSLVGVGPVLMIAGGIAALGFFSLLVFNIPTIRTFGVFTGLGIVSVVVLEMTFIPAVRSLLPAPSERERNAETRDRPWDRILRWIGNQIIPAARRRWVMLGLVLFALLCVLGVQRVVLDNTTKTFFASNLDIQKDDDFLNRELAGTNSLYIMVEGADSDAIKDPSMLAAIESTQRFAESQLFVGKTISIVDFLKRMNQAMHGDNPADNKLPDSRDLVSQYLLLYSLSGEPGDFDAYVDYQYKAAKITVLLKTGSNAYVSQLIDKLQAHAEKAFGRKVTIGFGGDIPQTVALTETMVKGKLLNIIQIALVIFVISALVFRSLTAGLIVLLPLAMAVIAVFGVMGFFDIPLNIPNSLISAMAVGIGADYAIYLLYRMREQVQLGADAEFAVRKTLATAGKAVLYVATAVSAGYAVLALSIGYNVHLWLSLFIVLAMVVSAWTSLTLVPSLVLYWKPKFIFGAARAWPMWHLASLLVLGTTLLVVLASAHAEAYMNPIQRVYKEASRSHSRLTAE